MNSEDLKRSVTAALAAVQHPNTGIDLISSGHIQNLDVDDSGEVRFSFLLRPEDPGSLVKGARMAAEAVEGAVSVKVNVQLPQTGQPSSTGGGLKPGTVPAPTPKPGLLGKVGRVVAVSSGKGGVGKSMMASNLAAGFAARGLRVGLLDADIYGPNIPIMFGESRRPSVTGQKGQELIEPLEAHGVKLMSLGFLLEEDQPAIMRGPLIAGILKQFLEQVEWGDLDVMVVDMPPGTGDAQLSLVQTIDLDGAIMVTTPQGVSTGDVRRGIRMFDRVNTRVLGIVENMTGEVFGSGGGRTLANQMNIPYLGDIPLEADVRKAGDDGRPTIISSPDSRAGQALARIIDTVARELKLA